MELAVQRVETPVGMFVFSLSGSKASFRKLFLVCVGEEQENPETHQNVEGAPK